MKKCAKTKNYCTHVYNACGIALIVIVLFSFFVYVCNDLTGSFSSLIENDLWNKMPYVVLFLLLITAKAAFSIFIIDVKNKEVLPSSF